MKTQCVEFLDTTRWKSARPRERGSIQQRGGETNCLLESRRGLNRNSGNCAPPPVSPARLRCLLGGFAAPSNQSVGSRAFAGLGEQELADEKLWRAGCDERWRYSSTVFLLDLCNLSGSLGSNWKPSGISLVTDFRTLSAEILRRTSSRAAPVSAAGVAVSSA